MKNYKPAKCCGNCKHHKNTSSPFYLDMCMKNKGAISVYSVCDDFQEEEK